MDASAYENRQIERKMRCRAEGDCAAFLNDKANGDCFLAIGHFLRHVQNELAVFIFHFAQEAAQFVEETCFFPNAAPGDIVGRFTLG
jgi:hypothetical protein